MGNAGMPTGSASFQDGGNAMTGCSTVNLANGKATCTTAALSPGVHAITALYSGDATYGSGVAGPIDQTITGSPSGPASVSPPSPRPVADDLNADGRSDLLYRNAATGQVYALMMNGLSIASRAQVYVEPDTAWKIVARADVNGDGVSDLVWRNTATGQVYVQVFGSDGRPSTGAVVWTEPDPAWEIVATPDIDGDGNADLLWWNSSTGAVYAMLLDGASIKASGAVYAEPDTRWRIVAAGDFAGSGARDQVLWRNSATGQVYLMTLGYSGGAFTQSGTMIYQQPDTAWKIVGAADFDGDGKDDILWRNDSTGQVFMMLMNGGAIVSQGVVYTEPNPAWQIIANGDYDGDGKADILWRNTTTGQVYVMLMNGLATAAAGMVYAEPNTSWQLLGPATYSH
jgi:hypothetical protein